MQGTWARILYLGLFLRVVYQLDYHLGRIYLLTTHMPSNWCELSEFQYVQPEQMQFRHTLRMASYRLQLGQHFYLEGTGQQILQFLTPSGGLKSSGVGPNSLLFCLILLVRVSCHIFLRVSPRCWSTLLVFGILSTFLLQPSNYRQRPLIY